MRYRTPKTGSESWKTKFISVRPKYLSDRGKIYIFRTAHQGLPCEFFSDFSFFRYCTARLKISDMDS